MRMTSELTTTRLASGLSLREMGRQMRVGHARLARIERGTVEVGIETASTMAALLGLELSVTLHPVSEPVRDKGHLALLARFKGRLDPGLHWRTEVAMPIVGDRRSADAVIEGIGFVAVVEAETHLDDIQRLERGIAAKQRDLGARRAILLVADTRHNRGVILRVPELRRRFPVSTRASLASLSRGRDPDGDCLVVI